VQTEVDRLKGDGSGRRAKKARKIASILRELVRSPDRQKVVLETNPRVVWRLPPALDPQRERPTTLDMTVSDDRIVEAAFSYAKYSPSEDVRLLSHDTGPQLTATDLGMNIVQVPDEWLLEPEPDAASKTVADLQRRLAALEGAKPDLILSVRNRSSDDGPLVLHCAEFSPLSTAEIESLAKNLEIRNPLKNPRQQSGSPIYMGSLDFISEQRLSRYRQEYEKWQSEIRHALSEIPKYLQKIDQHMVVQIDLSNNGGASAERVIVEFEADGFFLYPPACRQPITGSQDWPKIKLPKAPELPRSISEDILGTSGRSIFDGLLPPNISLPDRHKFYWRPDRPNRPVKSWRFESDEFRHKLDPEVFVVRIVPNKGLTRGILTIRVSAANQAQPTKLELPIFIKHVLVESGGAFQAWHHSDNMNNYDEDE
jgi:hypothetical protein